MADYHHTTFDGQTIGKRMHAAIRLVNHHEWYASKNQLAKAVGPHGSQDYGYRIVKRCIRKNLLAIDSDHPDATPQGQGAVVLTNKGKRYLVSEGVREVFEPGLDAVTAD